MLKYYTYIHCKPDMTPFYVGKGHGGRCSEFSGRNFHHSNIVKKYGRENIVIIKKYRDSERSALLAEIKLIKMFRDAGFELANKSSGGESPASGIKHSAEAKLKMSQRAKGRKHTDESKRKMSLALTGKKFSDEHKKKLSVIAKNRKFTEETKKKMSEAHKGNKYAQGKSHTPSKETRLKMSLAAKGNKNWLGKKHSEETRQKMSESAKKRYLESQKVLE